MRIFTFMRPLYTQPGQVGIENCKLKVEDLWFAFGGSILFCRHRQNS
ncbi:hypothetical protein D1AOALGA4SA_12827 [Olavius algarvensis Delta 1 endosymbiont]|nr:hypothetical protein D1AOALGA4SA_12827 [Olavius algarvensis Delta 1 endosymbiont]